MSERKWATRLTGLGVLSAFLAVGLIVLAGPGYRFGVLPLKLAFMASLAAGLISIFAVLAIVLGMLTKGVRPGGWPKTVVALLIAGALSVQLLSWYKVAKSVPGIHDITTNVQDPPLFDALLTARAGAANPPEYAGEEVAKQQQAAYPDLVPIALEGVTESDAVNIAEQAAQAIGLESIITQPDKRTVEGTDVTFWYGYKDDVVMRIRSTRNGSVIDIRSKSRVGISDLGTNAKRIRALRDEILARAAT